MYTQLYIGDADADADAIGMYLYLYLYIHVYLYRVCVCVYITIMYHTYNCTGFDRVFSIPNAPLNHSRSKSHLLRSISSFDLNACPATVGQIFPLKLVSRNVLSSQNFCIQDFDSRDFDQ